MKSSKTSFIILYFVSNIFVINGLLCTNCTNTIVAFNNATEPLIECEGQLFEADVCQVIFHMNYLKKEIYLSLIGTHGQIGYYNLDLSVQNKFDEPKIIDTNITFTCNTGKDCAKHFYTATVSNFILNERILHEIETELFDPAALNIDQCSDNNDQPVKCQNGYGCHGFEIMEIGKTNFEGECRNDSTVTIFPRAYFRITLVQSNPILSTDWNHLGYTCNKGDLCNSRQKIKKMVKLANDYYPWEFIALNSSTKLMMTYMHIIVALIFAFQ